MLEMVDRMDARPGWRRPLKRIRVVALLCAALAGVIVFSIFDKVHAPKGEAKPEQQLIASIDLSIGNPAAAFARGETRAKADIEAGVLKLQTFGLVDPPSKADAARAERLKKRYDIVWVNAGRNMTAMTQAFADGYNSVSEPEIERRHGKDVLERLVHGEDSKFPKHRFQEAIP
jgi:hypothetical protein